MKLSKHAFIRFWDVHAWGGVVTALVLHVMFFFGAFTLFHEDLTVWQEGSVPRPAADAPSPPGLDRLLAPVLARPDVGWRIGVHELEKTGPLHVGYYIAGSKPEKWQELHVDRVTGAVTEPRSELGGFLYGLHFLWHEAVPWLYYVAGFLAVGLLLALVTGVLIHLKDLVRQIDQFRPAAKTRLFWSDLHKVLGVFGLPFQVLFAFTGILLCLAPFMYRPFVGTLFDKASEAEALFGWAPPPQAAAGAPTTTLGFDGVLARAALEVPGARFTEVTLMDRGRAGGRARISYLQPGVFDGRGRLFVSLADGRVLSHHQPGTTREGPTAGMTRWLYGLHFGRFGGKPLRFLFAILALATCFTLLSGNWIWLARREARRASFGNQLLARLTLAIGGGVVVATVALFWANRLLPWGLAHRPGWEQRVFFGVWTLVGTVLLLRPATRVDWSRLLLGTGLGLGAVPVLGVFTAEAHALNVARHGSWTVFGVDVALLVSGVLLALMGWVVARAGAARGARVQARAGAQVEPAPAAALAREASHG